MKAIGAPARGSFSDRLADMASDHFRVRMSRVRRRIVRELGDRFFDAWFEAQSRDDHVRPKRSDPAMNTGPQPIPREMADRIDAFEGEKPNVDQVAKAGADVIRLSDVDHTLKGRAVRMGVAWPLETLFHRGRISKRQFDAARTMRDLWDEGQFDRIKGASFNERVDGSHTPAKGPDGGSQARGRYLEAMRVFGPLQRTLIESVVIKGLDISQACDTRCDGSESLPNDPKRRSACVLTLVRAGLDTLVLHLRL